MLEVAEGDDVVFRDCLIDFRFCTDRADCQIPSQESLPEPAPVIADINRAIL